MSDPWVVVSEFYPRIYPGSEAENVARSTYELEDPESGFATKKEAVAAARRVRDHSPFFECWEEIKGKSKAVSADPPFCSFDLDNADNDEEQTINVVRLSEHRAKVARREKVLRDAQGKRKTEADRARKRLKADLQKSGCVHYSFPGPPEGVDAPAEAELLISNGEIYEVPRERIVKKHSDIADISPVDLSGISGCKSIMLRGTEESMKASNLEKFKESIELIFSSCKQLEELHWHNSTSVPEIIGSKSGPHAKEGMKALKVLSIPLSSCLHPDDLSEFTAFVSLERLDLRSCFDMEFGIGMHGDFGFNDNTYGCDSEDDQDKPSKPYTEPLLAVANSCKKLKEINLDGILNFDAIDYCLDFSALSDLEERDIEVILGRKEYS